MGRMGRPVSYSVQSTPKLTLLRIPGEERRSLGLEGSMNGLRMDEVKALPEIVWSKYPSANKGDYLGALVKVSLCRGAFLSSAVDIARCTTI